MAAKLDIFTLLEFLDQRNLNVYEALAEDPEVQREFEKNLGWLLPQWMTGASNDAAHRELVLRFNETCNVGWFEFNDHPELRAKLLAAVGLGKKTNHKFFKPGVKTKRDKLIDFIAQSYPDFRPEQLGLWCKTNSLDDLMELTEAAGLQKSEQDDLIQAYKAR